MARVIRVASRSTSITSGRCVASAAVPRGSLSPMSDVPAAAQPADATTERALPRRSRAHRARGRVLPALGLAAVVSIALIAWISRQRAPYVTHREAIVLASQIESATTAAQVTGCCTAEIAAPLLAAQATTTSLLTPLRPRRTFLGTLDERTSHPRLLFRLHAERTVQDGDVAQRVSMVLDYQELLLARGEDGEVRVVDLRSLRNGDFWWRELRAQERLVRSLEWLPSLRAFTNVTATEDPAAILAAYRRLPEWQRCLAAVRSRLVCWSSAGDLVAFRPVWLESRSWFPENLAGDFAALVSAQFSAPTDPSVRESLKVAISRIGTRIDDGAWLGGLRRLLEPKPKDD